MDVYIESLLSRIPFFQGMEVEDLANIANSSQVIHATREDIIFRKDDACTGLYLLIKGRVKLFFISPRGHEKVLEIVAPGRIFGESSLFHGANHQFYAQPLGACQLIYIAKPVIMAELMKNPLFSLRVIDIFAQRLFELTEDIESYSHDSGLKRVVSYLVHEALRAKPNVLGAQKDALKTPSVEKKNTLALTLQTSKGVIASRLNLSQEHFSRTLHELSESGLLSVDGRDILINDLALLWQYADRNTLKSINRQSECSSWVNTSVPRSQNHGDPLASQFNGSLSQEYIKQRKYSTAS